jgi:hypothetical protein
VLAKPGLAALGTVALAGAYVAHEGAVRVAVDEYKPGGTHLHLILPAVVVPLGLSVVPENKLREAAGQARKWLPALRAASAELARLPDVELVEVRDADEHVSVTKRGTLLVIDVQSPREKVYVSFPLKTLDQVCRKLEALAPRS